MKPKDIIKAYQKIKTSKWDYVFSGGRFTSSIFRSFKKNKNNSLKMIFPGFYKETQDIVETFHDAGQFYWGKKNSWKKRENLYFLVNLAWWKF